MKYKKHHEVSIFVSPNSKMCELAKNYFRDEGIEFAELDISKDKVAEIKMIEISEQNVTPVIEIDGRVVTGYRPDILDTILHEK